MTPLRSRRAFLTSGVLPGTSLLAGCLGRAEKPPEQPPGINSDSSIQSIGFDGGEMVVELSDDHDVTRLNLIDAGGELYTQTTVASGETTSRLEILDIRPGLGGYEHYEPGDYELVSVGGAGETNSTALELVPDLQIVDISQYRDGERNSDYGKLAVTVENVGTGPTWVYGISYNGAPNDLVNDPLNIDPGLPRLSLPSSLPEILLEPNESNQFVGDTTPLVFSDQEEQTCAGDSTFVVLIGSPTAEPIQQPVTISVKGESISVGHTGEYSCTEVSVKVVDGERFQNQSTNPRWF